MRLTTLSGLRLCPDFSTENSKPRAINNTALIAKNTQAYNVPISKEEHQALHVLVTTLRNITAISNYFQTYPENLEAPIEVDRVGNLALTHSDSQAPHLYTIVSSKHPSFERFLEVLGTTYDTQTTEPYRNYFAYGIMVYQREPHKLLGAKVRDSAENISDRIVVATLRTLNFLVNKQGIKAAELSMIAQHPQAPQLLEECSSQFILDTQRPQEGASKLWEQFHEHYAGAVCDPTIVQPLPYPKFSAIFGLKQPVIIQGSNDKKYYFGTIAFKQITNRDEGILHLVILNKEATAGTWCKASSIYPLPEKVCRKLLSQVTTQLT